MNERVRGNRREKRSSFLSLSLHPSLSLSFSFSAEIALSSPSDNANLGQNKKIEVCPSASREKRPKYCRKEETEKSMMIRPLALQQREIEVIRER